MKHPHQFTILVVEDDELSRATLLEFLDILHFQTLSADNGINGIIKAKRDRPNLILLDVQMPRMDGLTFLNKMIEENIHHIPVIMTTALGREDDVRNAIKRGARDYVVKPIDLDVLREKISRVLQVDI